MLHNLVGMMASLYACLSSGQSVAKSTKNLCTLYSPTPLQLTLFLHCAYFYNYTDPLSSYPSVKLLRKLQVDRWCELGAHLGLTEDQLEDAKKSSHPIAAVLLAAKARDINLKWNQIVKSLLCVGEYEVAESICNEHCKLAP